MVTEFQQKVYALCSKVPRDRITTYSEIAKAMKTKAYRAVGNALRHNPFAPKVPCHRVVCRDGSLGGFGGKMHSRKKIELLRKEGVIVGKDYRIKHFKKRLFGF